MTIILITNSVTKSSEPIEAIVPVQIPIKIYADNQATNQVYCI